MSKNTQMTITRLKTIMASHAKWLDNKYGGTRARFEDVTFDGRFKDFDFSRVSFENITAKYASFENCKFNIANFENCSFEQADFDNCEFIDCEVDTGVNFNSARFDKCNFNDAHLFGANFNDACFFNCTFVNAHLNDADFRDAEFNECNLTDIYYNELTAGIALACPEKGEFTAFKKAELYNGDNCIVELQVPADALRSSATTRKCRVSKAKVVAVYTMDGKSVKQNAYSKHTHSFAYKIGKTVEVKNFDKNRWNECSTGIHCFITMGEAELYY